MGSSLRFYAGQIQRIEQGFITLGHESVEKMVDADLLYSNDPGGYKTILAAHYGGRLKQGARLIFNVQDIPEHLMPNYDIEGLSTMLDHAHAVTSISEFVRSQLIRYLKRGSSVVYQPIMPITHKPEPRLDRYARFLHAGRRTDPNKRFGIAAQALQLLGINYGQLGLVGGEFVNWGEHFGQLKDDQLNQVYNSVDFVLTTSAVEGLCLPVLEAMAAGVIPIICNDMTTRRELLPPGLFPEYEDVSPTPVSVSRFVAKYLQDNGAMQEMKARLLKHYTETWAARVSPTAVAAAILKVYERVKP